VCGGGDDDDDDDDDDVCDDTDRGATDSYGDTCDDYADYPYWCGGYDDDDFTSSEMCCTCGGGAEQRRPSPTPTPAPSAPTSSPTACENTDYDGGSRLLVHRTYCSYIYVHTFTFT
jgi:hypothetical protein